MSRSVVPPANDGAPTEVLELVHHHPGRLRVRAAVLRDNAPLFARIAAALEGVAGVRETTHNARTGSVLVAYEPGLAEPDAIADRIAETAHLVSPFDERARKPVAQPAGAVIEGTRTLNALAGNLTGGRADLRTLIPAALAGAAAYSFAFGKGPRLPRWDNLLWWSYSVFASLHAHDIAASAKGTGRADGDLGIGATPEGVELP